MAKNVNVRRQNMKRKISLVISVMLAMVMTLSLVACGNKASSTTVGEASFTFEVVDGDGNTDTFEISTDKKTVGEALLDENLIEGEDSEYGLYVKTVNGITADYDVDQTYWAFYIDGEYATTGVDTTDVVDGSTYSFKVEK